MAVDVLPPPNFNNNHNESKLFLGGLSWDTSEGIVIESVIYLFAWSSIFCWAQCHLILIYLWHVFLSFCVQRILSITSVSMARFLMLPSNMIQFQVILEALASSLLLQVTVLIMLVLNFSFFLILLLHVSLSNFVIDFKSYQSCIFPHRF